MNINDIQFNAELEDILFELLRQLRANNIELIQKYKPGITDIQICCPYHNNGQERRPSAGITKADMYKNGKFISAGTFHCFACGETHSLPEVISYCFGYTEDIIGKFGWQWLLKNFAVVKSEERKDVELDLLRDIGNKKVVNRDNRFITEAELDKYRYIHPYMYKRGLTDEIISLFDIGYDSDTDCITFPVRDVRGNCLFIARRSVKTKFFNYPEGVEKPLYGLYELDAVAKALVHSPSLWGELIPHGYPDEIIVCESMLDALSFWTVDKYAVALNGLGNELQFKQLRELPCRKIILATDNDERGMVARKRIKQNIRNRKIVTEYLFPEGRKDANDCTKDELRNLKEIF